MNEPGTAGNCQGPVGHKVEGTLTGALTQVKGCFPRRKNRKVPGDTPLWQDVPLSEVGAEGPLGFQSASRGSHESSLALGNSEHYGSQNAFPQPRATPTMTTVIRP